MILKDGIYNRDVFWPNEVQRLVDDCLKNKMVVMKTDHYVDRAYQNKVNVGTYKAAMFGNVVEAYVSGNKVVKIVTRLKDKYDKERDICFAISFLYNYEHENLVAVVKTVWKNRRGDNHETKEECAYMKGFLN